MPPDQFTEDMIFDILTHASLDTVGRCRSVSRKWNRVTYEPSFMDLHPHRARTIAGYFVQGLCDGSFSTRFVPATGEIRDLSLGFLPGPVRIEACDLGILLCRKLEGSATAPSFPEYYVCKPSTKEWVRIPSPRTGSFPAVTAMVLVRSKPDLRFKVLRISMNQRPGSRQHYCEIFDSEAWKWKRLADIAVPYEHMFARENPVVVAGKAFWFTVKRDVLVFDMYEETWSVFPVSIPDLDMDHYLPPRLVKHEGKLGLLFQCRMCNDKFVDLFVMENLSTQAWERRRRICFQGIGRPLRRLLAIYSENVVLMQGFYEVLLCRSDGETACAIKSSRIDVDEVFAFCSDFEPGNLKASRKSFKEMVSLPSDLASGMDKLIRKWISMPCWMNVIIPAVYLILAAGYVMF